MESESIAYTADSGLIDPILCSFCFSLELVEFSGTRPITRTASESRLGTGLQRSSVFTARRHASAVLAVAQPVSVNFISRVFYRHD